MYQGETRKAPKMGKSVHFTLWLSNFWTFMRGIMNIRFSHQPEKKINNTRGIRRNLKRVVKRLNQSQIKVQFVVVIINWKSKPQKNVIDSLLLNQVKHCLKEYNKIQQQQQKIHTVPYPIKKFSMYKEAESRRKSINTN